MKYSNQKPRSPIVEEAVTTRLKRRRIVEIQNQDEIQIAESISEEEGHKQQSEVVVERPTVQNQPEREATIVPERRTKKKVAT